MHQLWESRTDEEYFTLCKILTEFPNKFREYDRTNITTFHYILDSVKDDLQGYFNSRKCTDTQQKLKCYSSLCTHYYGKDKNKLHL
jgi:hypothetical protein